MKRINPHSAKRPYLLPCNIYPFIAGGDGQSYILARVNLKLCCLLHDNIALPGSLALQHPFVRSLVIELLPFFSAGTVKLDLRSSCTSFTDLAADKYGGNPPSEANRMAELLDSTCESILVFDAQDTSNEYRRELQLYITFLLSRARRPDVISMLEMAQERMATPGTLLTLDQATALLSGSYLSSRFASVAKLLYSTIGAKVTNSRAVVPIALWEAAELPIKSAPQLSFSRTDRQLADRIVMDYFSVDSAAIDKLDGNAILELKAEPLTARYIRELDEAIEEASIVNLPTNAVFSDLTRLAEDRAESIKRAVFAKCEREQKHLKIESWVIGAVEEVGGVTSNLAGLGYLKRGLASLARRLAKKSHKLSWLDFTSAPLATHVSRYREFISRRRTDLKLAKRS